MPHSEVVSSVRKRGRKAGFSLVEVIIAIVILAVGVLGLAGTTAYIVRQITLSDLLTERAVALQRVIEDISALPFDSVKSGTDTIGLFDVKWTVTKASTSASIQVVTSGPGLSTSVSNPAPALGPNVADTFVFTVISR